MCSVPLHTMLTELQLFAAPLDSRPDVQADQGSTPKALSSFTWEWGGSGKRATLGSQVAAPTPPPLWFSLLYPCLELLQAQGNTHLAFATYPQHPLPLSTSGVPRHIWSYRLQIHLKFPNPPHLEPIYTPHKTGAPFFSHPWSPAQVLEVPSYPQAQTGRRLDEGNAPTAPAWS